MLNHDPTAPKARLRPRFWLLAWRHPAGAREWGIPPCPEQPHAHSIPCLSSRPCGRRPGPGGRLWSRLGRLRGEFAAKGISGATFDRHTQGLQPDTGVLELMDAQPEFKQPIWDYLAGLVD